MKSPAGHWQPDTVLPGARTEEGLVVYRFGASLYYANASRLIDDVTALAAQGKPAAVNDPRRHGHRRHRLHRIRGPHPRHRTPSKRHIHLAVSTVLGPVREQLDRYGPGAYYDTPAQHSRPSTPQEG